MTAQAATRMQDIDAMVIGTSAGGVEALSQILPSLPAALRLAVFVVLHIPRERPSLLSEIFAAKCALAVREAEDKEPVAPGTIYFAPPDYHLLIDRGPGGEPQLALSRDQEVHFSRPSIDVLFQSAADCYGERLLGIILTGANEDGADGLAGVRRAGGVTIVQEPGSAQAPMMAEAALKRGRPDQVLTLAQMASLFKTLDQGGGRPALALPASNER